MTASAAPASAGSIPLGYAIALTLLATWSTFILISRFAVTTTVDPLDLALLRLGTAALALAPWTIRFGFGGMRPSHAVAIAATAGLGFALFAYHAFLFAPAAHGAVLMPGALPLWTSLLAILLLGDRPGRGRLLGLGLIACGAALLLIESGGGAARPGQWIGDLMFLAASFCWGLYTIGMRAWALDGMAATRAVVTIAAIALLPIWLADGGPARLAALPLETILAQAGFHGLIGTLLNLILYNKAVAILGPTRPAIVTAFVPVCVTLAGIPLLGEAPGPWTWAGLAAASIGILTAVTRR